MELLIYLVKVSACTVLFFAFYLLVLRHLTFFKINRFYLLLTLLLSFVIPTLNFTIEREVEAIPTAYTQPQVFNEEFVNEPITSTSSIQTTPIIEESFDYYSLLPYLYFGIVFSLLVIATWRILQLLKHTKNGAERINGLKIVQKSSGFTNCSFFNYVFIDDKLSQAELQVLLKHEEVHAKQLHSIDKILLMIIKAFLWFNPVVYLYDKALEQAHEYEADEATSQNFGTEKYASLLLRLAIAKSEMPLVHNFVKSPIKDRIKMLFNSKSKNMKKLMYLLALPIGLGLLWGFTVKVVDVSKANETEEKIFTLVLDAGHGGKEKGAVVNGISEKDITLAMAKKIKAFAEGSGIKVITTRDADENISIKDRVKVNGDILISLHVNSEPLANGGKRNGIEMYTALMDGTLKVPKANSLTYYLFKGLQPIKGIDIKDDRKAKSLMLLRESNVPGVILELGYLTNKNDFEFITNKDKQNELAKGIVNGILIYKNTPPKHENYDNKSFSIDKNLFNKTIKGTVKSILITEVGEVINFNYDKGLIRVFNFAKGKVSVGDELSISIGGSITEIVMKDSIKNLIKKVDAPCYLIDMMKTLDGKVIFDINNIPFLSKKVVMQYGQYKSEKFTLHTVNGKIPSVRIMHQPLSNEPSKVFIYVNGKLYSEKETLKFDKKFIASLSEKRGFAKADDYDIPIITDRKKTYIFWFGNEPKLASKTTKSRNFSQKHNSEKTNSQLAELNNSSTTKKLDDFFVKNSIEIIKPILLRSTSITVDTRADINYIKNGVMEIGEKQLDAEEIAYDKRNQKLTAKNGKLKLENGSLVSEKYIIYDLKKNSYITNSTPGNKIQVNSVGTEFLTKLKKQNDSLKLINILDQPRLLMGAIVIQGTDYVLNAKLLEADPITNIIKAHLASVLLANGSKLSGDIIEYDIVSKNYKITNRSGSLYRR